MRWLVSFVGNLLFLCCFFNFAFKYGTRWEFGPHLLIKTIVAEDGAHYGDGSPIDEITLALVRTDTEEAYQLLVIGLLALTVATYFICERRRAAREWERIREVYLTAFASDLEQSQ
jgi:hypothetical protein